MTVRSVLLSRYRYKKLYPDAPLSKEQGILPYATPIQAGLTLQNRTQNHPTPHSIRAIMADATIETSPLEC